MTKSLDILHWTCDTSLARTGLQSTELLPAAILVSHSGDLPKQEHVTYNLLTA